MATRTLRNKPGAVHFATFTCYQWPPLFKETNGYDLFYQWMQLAHEKGFRFLGYVILPNHVHFSIRVPEEGHINSTLSNGKRFMAYAIIERLTRPAATTCSNG
jgi:REP element-mobilizing transposase RayT